MLIEQHRTRGGSYAREDPDAWGDIAADFWRSFSNMLHNDPVGLAIFAVIIGIPLLGGIAYFRRPSFAYKELVIMGFVALGAGVLSASLVTHPRGVGRPLLQGLSVFLFLAGGFAYRRYFAKPR